ncbi:MAG TPA: Gfo/Idh/MocA family oxidoreductase [Candidatus Acidoferrales bacterium]|nr:Gfo/Idh/MocA family oxidoreductase [Candidatus Acidoferrales bacterium]
MARIPVGIIMNGVTGRMGMNQHLIRSIVAIREAGGLAQRNGDVIWPEPVLLGRNAEKVAALAQSYGINGWSTSLEECLADPSLTIYFDAQTTSHRAPAVRAAIAAGKHIYVEKPIADDLPTALDLARRAQEAGVKNGVVHDKLWLPGLRKLKRLIDGGFFGRILSIRGEFGYWVFEGDIQSGQRPSWNYRKEDGGGIILDMFAHWRYVLENLFAPVRAVSCIGATHIPQRVDEDGHRYAATADDAAYAIFELDGGIIAQINSSWCVRVYRDELVEFQVDGTLGSAIVGLRECKIQPRGATPRPVWNPDVPNPLHFRDDWMDVPDNENFPNAFLAQWELFLMHVVYDTPFPYTLLEGAKGVQLAELGLASWHERRWLDVPELSTELVAR